MKIDSVRHSGIAMPNDSSIDPGTRPPALQVMSTAHVPPKQRLEFWLDLVCSLYCQLDCDPPDTDAIEGTISFGHVADVVFSLVASNGRRLWLTPERTRAAGADHYVVLVPRSGRALVRQDGREALAQPGDFVLHDCSRPYELRFDDTGHALHALRLPRGLIDAHISNPADLTARRIDGGSIPGRLLLSAIEELHRTSGALHPASASAITEAIGSIVSAGLRGLPDANRQRHSNLSAYHLRRIKSYVREHLREPSLTPASVAAAVGLSVDHVGRLFRAEAASLSRLIWQQRMEACRRQLADPRWTRCSVSEIAFSWGFGDPAHFCRAFRRQYGLPPGEWRHLQLERMRTDDRGGA